VSIITGCGARELRVCDVLQTGLSRRSPNRRIEQAPREVGVLSRRSRRSSFAGRWACAQATVTVLYVVAISTA